MHGKTVLVGWGVLVVLATPGGAAARPPFIEHGGIVMTGHTVEVGAVGWSGPHEFGSLDHEIEPESWGLLIRDRNGITAPIVGALIVAFGGAARAAGPKSVETRSWEDSEYRYTQTTTTYHSEAEKAQIREETSETAAGLLGLDKTEFELFVFARDRFGAGESSGFKLNFLYGGVFANGSFAFETGFGWGHVESEVDEEGTTWLLDQRYLGMPFRLSWANRLFMAQLTFEWNWMAHVDEYQHAMPVADMATNATTLKVASHPWALDVHGALFGHFGGSLGITQVDFASTTIGLRAQAYLRF